MQFSILLLSSLATMASSAAIEKRHISAWPEAIRDYFSSVSDRVYELRSTATRATPTTCDMSSATMPTISGLPPPSEGLSIYHVVVGRGTQNYTCDPAQPSSTPTAIGAVATLYNTTCLSSMAPGVFGRLTRSAILVPTPKAGKALFPANALASGHHYFTGSAPTFNLHTELSNYGIDFAKLDTKVPAPSNAAVGSDGSKAVPWLKLLVQDPPAGSLPEDSASGVKEIYRVNTAGGSAPKTCEGQPASFQKEYAAEYWFLKQ
ncbi:MAG: hypothetical protein LQ342_003190 [Letrouitia transgressa]|nr:MAG: hypothetical protein LQ342_003190 [Letrouitia transgressa]